MSAITTFNVTDKMSIEVVETPYIDGYAVNSVVKTSFGSKPAINQIYWAIERDEAMAFYKGFIAAAVMYN